MQFNRDGVTRTVFLIGHYAIKFPSLRYSWRLFLRGLLSNMNERDIWNWSSFKDWAGPPRDLLAKVIFACPGGWFLIMERATRTMTEEEYSILDVSEFKKWVSDCKADNIGVFPDGSRIIDYGEGWTIVEAEHENRGTLGSPTKRENK